MLRLWDMLIAVDDPAFNFFIGLCMLREHRAYLIMSDVDAIPEIISGIKIKVIAYDSKIRPILSLTMFCLHSCRLRPKWIK